MKLIKIKSLSPKRLFRSRRSRSNSNLDPSLSYSNYSSASASTSSSVHNPGEADGVLSRRELEALLSRLGAGEGSREEAEMLLRGIGIGCGDDGGVGIEELVGRVGLACGGEAAGTCEEELRRAFEFFDGDGDGRITAEELLGVFGGVMGDERCTLEDCRRMIAGVDGNRDGFVCFEDFSRMMGLQVAA